MRMKAAEKFLKEGHKVVLELLVVFIYSCIDLYTQLQCSCTVSCCIEHVYSSFQLKVIVTLRGRANAFLPQAIELIRKFRNDLGEVSILIFN